MLPKAGKIGSIMSFSIGTLSALIIILSVFSGYLYYEKLAFKSEAAALNEQISILTNEKLSLQSQVKELTGRIIDLKEFKRILIGFIYS